MTEVNNLFRPVVARLVDPDLCGRIRCLYLSEAVVERGRGFREQRLFCGCHDCINWDYSQVEEVVSIAPVRPD